MKNSEKKEISIIMVILVGVVLIGISSFASYAIFANEITSENEIKGIVTKKVVGSDFLISKTPAAETIISKVGTGGLVAESHTVTPQLKATTDYRYTGKDPDNYIKFNNETWRIIGVFETDNGSGTLEKRIKIIHDSIGDVKWDISSINDWSKASAMTTLNSGEYYNRTDFYASNGLTDEAKSLIANAKWYLGGTNNYTTSSNGLIKQWYAYERGTTVYSGRPTNWTGKVGLMYPSDYGYATSGGTTNNREACLQKELYNWRDTYSDCIDNNWLYNSSKNLWTITHLSGSANNAFGINTSGYISSAGVNYACVLKPTVYLKSNVAITKGNGTKASPYEIAELSNNQISGLVAQAHLKTSQLQATTAYLYTGKTPNNYVKFNNETWRIIGIFDVDNGTGTLEKRIKIIKDTMLGYSTWGSGSGNWATASLMTLLNSGAYYNRTGSYASTGLTEEAKNLIADAKWYLGGFASAAGSSAMAKTPSNFYEDERSSSSNWVGKVGLIYISDYGYATSGGTTTNKETCLDTPISSWNASYVSDCRNNNWMFNGSSNKWTIVYDSSLGTYAIYISNDSTITSTNKTNSNSVFPTVYLKPDIQITGGNGTSTSPYELKG